MDIEDLNKFIELVKIKYNPEEIVWLFDKSYRKFETKVFIIPCEPKPIKIIFETDKDFFSSNMKGFEKMVCIKCGSTNIGSGGNKYFRDSFCLDCGKLLQRETIDHDKALEKIEKLNKPLEEEFQKDTEYNRWLWKITDGKVGFKCHE